MSASSTTPAAARRSTRAVVALLVVTVLWGWTFVWMKQSVGATVAVLGPRGGVAGSGLFLALRFGLAALVMLALPGVRAKLDRAAWRAGLWIGLALLAGFLLQLYGLEGVTPAESAFLTSLYVLFTALLTAARHRAVPHPALLAGVLLATFGAGFIGGPPQLGFGLAQGLTIGCALVFALHILVTDHFTQRLAPLPLTFTSFVVVAVGATLTVPVGMALAPGVDCGALRELLGTPEFALPLVLSSLLATALALTLMNLFQRELDPVRAAIVYAVEPIWATAISMAQGRELPNGWLFLGGGALLVGNLVAELGPFLFRRR